MPPRIKSLNVFRSQRECEAALPDFVNATYPEFRPQANLLNHQVVMNGVAESPSRSTRCHMAMHNHFHDGGSVTPAIDSGQILPASIFTFVNINIHQTQIRMALRRFRNLDSIPNRYLKHSLSQTTTAICRNYSCIESVEFEIDGTGTRRQKSQNGREAEGRDRHRLSRRWSQPDRSKKTPTNNY